MRFWKKLGKFNNFPGFRALFGIIIRDMALENIREVRWHVVSVVFFLNFCGELHNLVRFNEFHSKLYMHACTF